MSKTNILKRCAMFALPLVLAACNEAGASASAGIPSLRAWFIDGNRAYARSDVNPTERRRSGGAGEAGIDDALAGGGRPNETNSHLLAVDSAIRSAPTREDPQKSKAGAEIISNFVPTTEKERKQLQVLLTERRARIEEHADYIRRLQSRLEKIRQQPASDTKTRQISSIALRIVRIGSQIEIDELRELEIRSRLAAAEQGTTLDRAKLDNRDVPEIHRERRAGAYRNIQALVREADVDIRDERSRQSFLRLQEHLGRELDQKD